MDANTNLNFLAVRIAALKDAAGANPLESPRAPQKPLLLPRLCRAHWHSAPRLRNLDDSDK